MYSHPSQFKNRLLLGVKHSYDQTALNIGFKAHLAELDLCGTEQAGLKEIELSTAIIRVSGRNWAEREGWNKTSHTLEKDALIF